MSQVYNIRNYKQTNYAGVTIPPRSTANVNGYTTKATSVTFDVQIESSGSDGVIVTMGSYTFVPNSPEKLPNGNVVLTDQSKLKDYQWNIEAVSGIKNAYRISKAQDQINYLWTLSDPQDGTNVKLSPQIAGDGGQVQYWIFEVSKFA